MFSLPLQLMKDREACINKFTKPLDLTLLRKDFTTYMESHDLQNYEIPTILHIDGSIDPITKLLIEYGSIVYYTDMFYCWIDGVSISLPILDSRYVKSICLFFFYFFLLYYIYIYNI